LVNINEKAELMNLVNELVLLYECIKNSSQDIENIFGVAIKKFTEGLNIVIIT